MLGEQFAGEGTLGATSDLFESAFLATNLLDASLVPWMLFGMGIILFSVGRFFSTIVGFVEARRMVTAEGTEAIAEALNSSQTKDDEMEPTMANPSVNSQDLSSVEVPYQSYP